ncbi:MAG: sigma-70 family RNA polymerase sigma factor [Candidatus Peribacteria bacterium]|nr:MAG: sigma-70 family RNA polymerase sigma factor [Candidatus Peribacteria bacterium]
MLSTDILYDRYSDEIHQYIKARVTGSAADDILQQVFLKAHQNRHSLHKPELAKSWLYRITQHAIIDWYRSEGRQQEQPYETAWRDRLESEDQKEQQLAHHIASCIIPMIDDLDPQTKTVLDAYLDHTPLQKIADQTHLSLSNVKVLIHRSKKKLSTLYKQCCSTYTAEDGTLLDTRCRNHCGCAQCHIQH